MLILGFELQLPSEPQKLRHLLSLSVFFSPTMHLGFGFSKSQLRFQRIFSFDVDACKALYAIQLTCEQKIIDEIGDDVTAQEAWNYLTLRYGSELNVTPDIEQAKVDDNLDDFKDLYKWEEEGHWEAVELFIEIWPGAFFEKSDFDGRTVLHAAAMAGHEEVIKGEISRYLFDIPNNDGKTPLLLAAQKAHKDMTRYLYQCHTTDQIRQNFCHLLKLCIQGKISDVALGLLESHLDGLTTGASSDVLAAMFPLARMHSAFFSGCQFNFLERIIYRNVDGRMVHEAGGEEMDTVNAFRNFSGHRWLWWIRVSGTGAELLVIWTQGRESDSGRGSGKSRDSEVKVDGGCKESEGDDGGAAGDDRGAARAFWVGRRGEGDEGEGGWRGLGWVRVALGEAWQGLSGPGDAKRARVGEGEG
ncbi:hypothetical protein Fmac_002888 [Flemingia macrophylla]|uniref:Uncharacterized protein n=1 Tax=Flemingia macrophylla TaxID=520843 RepID=A0ABD1NMY6_9FABA